MKILLIFFRLCYQSKQKEERCCPHCNNKRPPLAVQLKLSMSKAPLKIMQYTSKMSLSKPVAVSNGRTVRFFLYGLSCFVDKPL